MKLPFELDSLNFGLFSPCSTTYTALGALTAVLIVVYSYSIAKDRKRRGRTPYPPGPKGELLFGNARQIPPQKQWEHFAKWREEYGPLVFMRILSTPYIVINSGKVAFELLDKRSGIYSDRPQSIMAMELVGWDFNMTLVPYTTPNDKWRRHRRVMHQALNSRAVDKYKSMQLAETHLFLQRVVDNPENLDPDVRRLAGSTIMKMAYGYTVKADDPYVHMVEHAVDGLTQTLGVGFLVDALPFLKYVPGWFPGAGFKTLAKEWRVSTRGILEKPWAHLMDEYYAGKARESYCTTLLEAHGGPACDAEMQETIKETSAVIYAAGADSTLSLICSFFLAMVLHPNVLKRAQEELDRVVGSDRLPTFEDRPNLPYVDCVIRETYRWNPAAPIGVAHRLTQDDVYEGMFIPEGTTILPNIWGMMHDPELYGEDHLDFRPERHEGLSEKRFKETDPRNFAFGFGRRICIGQYFADNALFIALSSIMHCLDIRKKIGPDGKVVEPKVEYPHFVGHPAPFDCDIKLRDEKKGLLIREAIADGR
ncbi:cytochrome P450 [Punctularia strigosozonata HHB-11173 SS5]|uniref:cytochrome P450 n=1 Tax=Punctularia strigosozonata (strain HHB-11173) TaxID=741275 RepID=UPI00044183A3|nr:cytochrome P450 [Punctularia strigosozonata HHB-11173 SS5]EIN09014.1 cytochrome P450 [Punctularia strigosozonata HHB-11173 SS5]